MKQLENSYKKEFIIKIWYYIQRIILKLKYFTTDSIQILHGHFEAFLKSILLPLKSGKINK